MKDQTTARESAPTPMDAEARIIVHGPSGPKVFVAVRGGTVIGRAFPADVIVDDPSVSKQHVRIALAEDGSVRFADLGSTNGIWLNGLRVTEGALARGDTLRAGAAQIEPYVRPSVDVPGVLAFDAFAQRLTDAAQRHLVTTQPFSVLVVEGEETVPLAEWAPGVLSALRAEDRAARLRDEALVVLLVDAGDSEARAVASAIAQGDGALAVGVATYPVHGRDASALVAHAFADRAARRPSVVPAPPMVHEGVVRGRATEALWGMVERAAPSSVPVLVLGETGSGKELVAQALHQRSSRADKNFRVVNCGAIPENLVESTLFGAERGAFTGADRMLRGLFEQAHGGTLFLDEVGELPLSAQASLLRVLETGRITRIGGDRELAVDVRVVSATHRDLEARCNEGAFRWDLYYRLNGLSLELPPLRARRDEIAPLVGLFLRAAADGKATPLAVDAEAMNALIGHAWPGNIRELRHTIQRAILVTEGPVITLDALPERVRASREGPVSQTAARPTLPVSEESDGLRDELRKHETRLITEALARTNGNTAAAAALLQIPIRTLTHKMVVLGIRRDG